MRMTRAALARRLPSPHSLRARLLLFLLLAVASAALVQGVIAYQGALRQADEVFDYQLQRTALSLGTGAPVFVPSPADDRLADAEQRDLIIQIWTLDGLPLFHSSRRPIPASDTPGFSTREAAGTRYRVYALQTPLQHIQVAQDVSVRTHLARSLAWRAIWPIVAIAPLLMLIVAWVVGTALVPMRRARAQVAARQPDDLAPVAETGLPDEVRPLVHEFNLLLRRVDGALDAQRRFVGDAAHELRSPLAALTLQVEALRRTGDEAGRDQAIARLSAGIARASRLVDQLLALARADAPAPAPAPLDLVALARDTLADLLPLAQARRIDIGMDAPPAPVPLRGQPDALALLLRNLLDNAIKYTPDGGRVDLALRAGPDGTLLRVEDSGPGISADQQPRVFDRFYRAPGVSMPGNGLGLAIVRAIADRHGAHIALGTSPTLGGLAVTVTFPHRP